MGVEVFMAPATSHVARMEWDDESEDLRVTYTDGSVYVALNCTRREWQQAQTARPIGAFLNRHFRGRLSPA